MEVYLHSRFVASWRGQGRLHYFVFSLRFILALLFIPHLGTSLCALECCAWTESPRTKGTVTVAPYKARITDTRNILLRIFDRCEVSRLITEVADGARGGMVSI